MSGNLISSTNITKHDFTKIEQAEAKAAEAKAAKVGKAKLVRTTVDLSRSMHTAIKVKAANRGITIREYMMNLIEQDLNPPKPASDGNN